MADVAEIAARLSEAQREALMQADGGHMRFKHALGTITPKLREEGLLPRRLTGREQSSRLTPLGLAVRDYLANQPESV